MSLLSVVKLKSTYIFSPVFPCQMDWCVFEELCGRGGLPADFPFDVLSFLTNINDCFSESIIIMDPLTLLSPLHT